MIEGDVLAAVIILNPSIGFFQGCGADKKMDAPRSISSPGANVLRHGKTQVIFNSEVAPGETITLKMGDTIPANLRLFEVMNLSSDEQTLTGESVPADKIEKYFEDAELSIGDGVNIAYVTTIVRKCDSRGVVIATGVSTEVSKLAASTSRKDRKEGRSMNYKKYGKRQPVVGLAKRIYDFIDKFLGLTKEN
ncbi:E1-E2 ATPase-domain-containing protein [Xylariales sp. AK1849]|nr:E1-E2 ATPase-domain-containing protein [Xylariales sp. AK1849]